MRGFNCNFFEAGFDIIPLINQSDVNTDVTGDWVSLKHYTRCLLLIAKYGTEDVDTIGFQVVQASTNTGTGVKAVTALFPYWYKQAVLTDQAVWTGSRLTTADDILGMGTSAPTGGTLVATAAAAADAFLLAIDVQATDLDVDGGFDFLTVRVEGDEVNNALLISAWAILMGGRFPQNVPLTAVS